MRATEPVLPALPCRISGQTGLGDPHPVQLACTHGGPGEPGGVGPVPRAPPLPFPVPAPQPAAPWDAVLAAAAPQGGPSRPAPRAAPHPWAQPLAGPALGRCLYLF